MNNLIERDGLIVGVLNVFGSNIDVASASCDDICEFHSFDDEHN